MREGKQGTKKEVKGNPGDASLHNLSGSPPRRTVVHDPVHQGLVETDVISGLFRFDPLMFEDFLTLSLKLPIEGEVSDEFHILRNWL